VKTVTPKPTRGTFTVLQQLCKFIPGHLLPKLAREEGAEQKARTFSYWSQLTALMFAQLTHAIGLNDVCDTLRLRSGPLSALRGATPPSRNNFSHANKERPAAIAEKLFWATLKHLFELQPAFGKARSSGARPLARRFKSAIHVVDSTTIALIASCLDWAKHRRRKAAAKCHLRLDLRTMLPRMAIIDTAKDNDNKRARELCADIAPGEIVLFDKAYVDFEHLYDLQGRGVWWVTRAKDNMQYKVIKRLSKKPHGMILRDDLVRLKVAQSKAAYPQLLRVVVALVEVDGQWREMTFLSNNLNWQPGTIADLYRCRWQIEVFFKQIKQTLQLGDFLGNSANAVRWQVWTALLVYLLLRFESWLSNWSGSFARLWAVIRSALWLKIDLVSLLNSYGIAGGAFSLWAQPQEAYLPGLKPHALG
jgi:hypothetical protein